MIIPILRHRDNCPGTITCKICERKGCGGCIRTKRAAIESNRPETEGMCVICHGLYKENEILLYPPKESILKGWDA